MGHSYTAYGFSKTTQPIDLKIILTTMVLVQFIFGWWIARPRTRRTSFTPVLPFPPADPLVGVVTGGPGLENGAPGRSIGVDGSTERLFLSSIPSFLPDSSIPFS